MTYTLDNIIKSIAQMLRDQWPELTVYDSRTPSGTKYPCFFIQLMPSSIQDQIDRRDLRRVSLDIVYIQQRNIPNASREILQVADQLDELLELIQYSDGQGTPVPLHTHDRNYSIEDQELHYKLTLRNRVMRPAQYVKINQVEEFDVEI